ncbi:rCG26543, isoform CRA_a [Rattus norvegicus]|uniref:RCG26543, isoform CRA_a n=1 Tax=Rattus norvegicus TaxID=10116 RepID=A6HPA9_RAT|nr:rCG26543, isoform CRA_a [Rattus norvegicus]
MVQLLSGFCLVFEITVIVLLKVVLSYRWVVFLGYII